MLNINSQNVYEILVGEFPTLSVSLLKEEDNSKITLEGKGGSMFLYPQNAHNFSKIYNISPFSNEEEYVNYVIADIKEFYGETIV